MRKITIKQMPKIVNQYQAKKAERSKLNKEFDKLYKHFTRRIEYLDREIKVAETITDFWNGIPIRIEPTNSIYGKGYKITSYSDNLERNREITIYPNADASKNGMAKRWHINIQRWIDSFTVFRGGCCILANAKSIESLMPMIREYIEKDMTEDQLKDKAYQPYYD